MANIINGTDTGSGGLITTGDSSDELQLQTAETARVTLTNTAVVVNEGGNDVDFRVESDTVDHALFVDGATGNIGMGTGSPAGRLDVNRSTASSGLAGIASAPQLCLTNPNNFGYVTGMLFRAPLESGGSVVNNSAIWSEWSSNNNAYLGFATTGSGTLTERMRLTSDGYLRMASGTGGIQFGGDTAAANALDDYEEGTWTPVVEGATTAGTASYFRQRGVYQKVGNTVFVSIHVQWNSGTGTGNFRISGLPFTSSNINSNDQYWVVNIGYIADITIPAGNIPSALIFPSNNGIQLYALPVGGVTALSLAYDAAGSLIMSGTYTV